MMHGMAKSDQNTPSRRLLQRVGRSDERLVDELYGLEPVYEPGDAGAALGAFAEFPCPCCCETIGTTIDLTDGSRVWIEDCQVCCQPMQITIEVDERGELRDVTAERLD
jgi:hypothetical protein